MCSEGFGQSILEGFPQHEGDPDRRGAERRDCRAGRGRPGHGKGKAKGHKPASSSFLRTSSLRGSRPPSGTRSSSGRAPRARSTAAACARATGDILVEGGPDVAGDDCAATGLKVDRYGRLFASGADSKHIRVYDAHTGDQLRDYFAGDDAGFINDVIVTKRGAYFTDSNNPWLYFIPFGQPRRSRWPGADPARRRLREQCRV